MEDFYNMQHEKEYFDLRSFFILIFRKAHIFIICIIAGFILGACVKGTSGYLQYRELSSDNASGDAQNLANQKKVIEEGIELYEDYEKRPLMRLNPTAVSVSSMSLYIDTDYTLDNTLTIQPPDPTIDLIKAYQGIPISSTTLEKINNNLNGEYDINAIRELIKFKKSDDKDTTSILELVVYGKNINESSFIANTFIEGAYELINPTVYPHKLVIIGESTSLSSNQELADIQKENIEAASSQVKKLESELAEINNKISESSPRSVVLKSVKYGIFTAVAATVIALMVVLVVDSVNTTLKSSQEYCDRYGIPVMGILYLKSKKLFEKTLCYLEDGMGILKKSYKEQLNLVCENILIRVGDLSGKIILLTGTQDYTHIQNIAKDIVSNLNENSIPATYYDVNQNLENIYKSGGNEVIFITSHSILQSGKAVSILGKVDYITMVENLNKSSHIAVDNIIKATAQIVDMPLGFILFR